MPKNDFLKEVLANYSSVKPPDINYIFNYHPTANKTSVTALQLLTIHLEQSDDNQNVKKYLNNARVLIEDTFFPIFMASCFNVTTEYIYSTIAKETTDKVEKFLNNFETNEASVISTNSENNKISYTVRFKVTVTTDAKDSNVFSNFNMNRKSLKRNLIGKSIFSLAIEPYYQKNDATKELIEIVDKF